ncbi:unnamed protein product [Protopolystoma xenopodis]|uniref:EGF-like domain-containing protein n=1 Tax=Protopolystoma xenopodis TaxID=117903 RepID=A0A448XJX9_9PLAT|nr:unnamed protein product [Protopolystoma xenopodis]
MAIVTDDADYDAGETFDNVPRLRFNFGNDHADNGLRTRYLLDDGSELRVGAPLLDSSKGTYSPYGEVIVVVTPNFNLVPPKPQPICLPSYCMYGGRCYAEDYQLKCDCRSTGYWGARCERRESGQSGLSKLE